ncbi:MFS transporter [bacterium]|nr:MFS transporter [bacterium]
MKVLEYNKKVGNAWAMYDWANSVYSLCISTAIFPLYYSAVVNPNDLQQTFVSFWGFDFDHTALLSYTISASFLVISLLLPLMSGIADYSGRKKLFMQAFVIIGSLACASLYFFDESHVYIGIAGAFLASIGFAGSLVFYNAFLPEIAPTEMYDRLSAKGYTLGYLGSVLLLIFCIAMIQMPETFGLENALESMKISFLLVAVWWLGFSQITLRIVPETKRKNTQWKEMLTKGISELKKVWQQLKHIHAARQFLSAFFFISMGVQTIVYMASIYAKTELGFETGELIIIILLIQLVAAAGAFAFSRISEKMGNIKTMMLLTSIWVFICLLAFLVTKETAQLFYIVAFLVGLVLGGIQSLARSTYSKLLPATHDHASFFSFYEITEKVAITLGTLGFGLVTDLIQLRYAPLLLMFFFIIALPLLAQLRKLKLAN